MNLPAPPSVPSRFRASGSWVWLLVGAGILVIALIYSGLGAPMPPDQIGWRSDLQAASLESQSRRQPMLLYFSASWCPPCKIMKRHTFTDPAIIALLREQWVPVLIDVTNPSPADETLARLHAVEYLPTLIVVSPEGHVRGRTTGGKTPAQLAAWLAPLAMDPP